MKLSTMTWFGIASAAFSSGCSESAKQSVAPPGAVDVPAAVSVPDSTLTSGVYVGPARRQEQVAGFRIAKMPVTVAQFRDCVAAKACEAPAHDACAESLMSPAALAAVSIDDHPADNLPMTCAGTSQAKAFCAWVGGTLPTMPQFLLAARGIGVTRYAWGNAAPSCEQHPAAHFDPLASPAPCASGDGPFRTYFVGQHPAGASPMGAEDVLLAPGEILGVTAGAHTPACAPPFQGCVAYGLAPGAIDGFEPLATESTPSHHAYAFRCVWTN